MNNIEPDILKNAEPKAINAVSDEIHFVEAHTHGGNPRDVGEFLQLTDEFYRC